MKSTTSLLLSLASLTLFKMGSASVEPEPEPGITPSRTQRLTRKAIFEIQKSGDFVDELTTKDHEDALFSFFGGVSHDPPSIIPKVSSYFGHTGGFNLLSLDSLTGKNKDSDSPFTSDTTWQYPSMHSPTQLGIENVLLPSSSYQPLNQGGNLATLSSPSQYTYTIQESYASAPYKIPPSEQLSGSLGSHSHPNPSYSSVPVQSNLQSDLNQQNQPSSQTQTMFVVQQPQNNYKFEPQATQINSYDHHFHNSIAEAPVSHSQNQDYPHVNIDDLELSAIQKDLDKSFPSVSIQPSHQPILPFHFSSTSSTVYQAGDQSNGKHSEGKPQNTPQSIDQQLHQLIFTTLKILTDPKYEQTYSNNEVQSEQSINAHQTEQENANGLDGQFNNQQAMVSAIQSEMNKHDAQSANHYSQHVLDLDKLLTTQVGQGQSTPAHAQGHHFQHIQNNNFTNHNLPAVSYGHSDINNLHARLPPHQNSPQPQYQVLHSQPGSNNIQHQQRTAQPQASYTQPLAGNIQQQPPLQYSQPPQIVFYQQVSNNQYQPQPSHSPPKASNSQHLPLTNSPQTQTNAIHAKAQNPSQYFMPPSPAADQGHEYSFIQQFERHILASHPKNRNTSSPIQRQHNPQPDYHTPGPTAGSQQYSSPSQKPTPHYDAPLYYQQTTNKHNIPFSGGLAQNEPKTQLLGQVNTKTTPKPQHHHSINNQFESADFTQKQIYHNQPLQYSQHHITSADHQQSSSYHRQERNPTTTPIPQQYKIIHKEEIQLISPMQHAAGHSLGQAATAPRTLNVQNENQIKVYPHNSQVQSLPVNAPGQKYFPEASFSEQPYSPQQQTNHYHPVTQVLNYQSAVTSKPAQNQHNNQRYPQKPSIVYHMI